MAEGRTNSAISRALVVTDGAVEKHISSIFAKLGPHPDDLHARVTERAQHRPEYRQPGAGARRVDLLAR